MSKVYFTEEELKNFLMYDERESKIFLPNVIFNELKENIDLTQKARSCEHIAYAYSYVYLISYLYRYAKYGDMHENVHFTQENLKKILQTSINNKEKNYITAQGGVLEKLRYIKKVKDFPFSYEYDYVGSTVEPEFIMYSELFTMKKYEIILPTIKQTLKLPKYFIINFPVRAFYLDEDYEAENYDCGYFYWVENTHMIPVEVFIFCMSRDDLGTVAFYLYSFLQEKSDHFPSGWACSYSRMSELTGIAETKLKQILKSLESYNMISNSHEPYYLFSNEQHKPNTYKTKHFKQFKKYKSEVPQRTIIFSEDDNQIGL